MIDQKRILYDYAMRFVGVPYVWGGSGYLTGVDCSGLVIELLIASGMWSHGSDGTSQSIFDHFEASGADPNRIGFGALCFYGKSVRTISHIGFALDNISMLESGGGDSRFVSRDDAARHNALVRIRPIKYRRDLVATLMPRYPFS